MGKGLFPDCYFHSIYDITPEFLKGKGIRGVILDIDNTLVFYGVYRPTARNTAWLNGLTQAGLAVAFVSNGRQQRVEEYNRDFGFLLFLSLGQAQKGGIFESGAGNESCTVSDCRGWGPDLHRHPGRQPRGHVHLSGAAHQAGAVAALSAQAGAGAPRCQKTEAHEGGEAMTAKFGPAGNSDAFYEAGNKATLQIPGYLESLGLTAYEYQCGRGVTVGEETARKLGAKAAEHGITLSLHAPYYISLSSVEPEKREASIGYLLASAKALDWMGGSRVILHSGSCGKMSREQALSLACETLSRARAALDEAGYAHIVLCPETMGKINQLGTLEEVLTLCELDERTLPCIDFGHLNARTLGAVRTQEDYAAILDAVEQRLGKERARSFHSHFSKIEYTAGGRSAI